MAVDMFIAIDSIKGESQDKKHAGEIDVLAWSWGASNSGTAHLGGGGGAGKVNVQDLSFTKYIDKSSPTLLARVADGKHIDSATLTVRKAGGNPVEYVVIKFTEVLISSISMGGSGGEDRLTENVSLNFASYEYKYTPQKADGTPDAVVQSKWNIAKNAES